MKTWDSDGVRTPQSYFDQLDLRYAFRCDLFASVENKKTPAFFDKPGEHALTNGAWNNDWPRLDAGWNFANPPYSRGNLPRFVDKAIIEAKSGSGIVALIPATPGTEWFNDRILRCCDVLDGYPVNNPVFSGYELSMQGVGYRQKVLFLKGRVPFDPPIGYPPEEDWNPPATDSIIWEVRPPLR